MKIQFLGLDKITGRDGSVKVVHLEGQHDDVANVVAGVSTLIFKTMGGRLSAEEVLSRMPHMLHGRTQEKDSPQRPGYEPDPELAQQSRVLDKLRADGVIN